MMHNNTWRKGLRPLKFNGAGNNDDAQILTARIQKNSKVLKLKQVKNNW